MLGKIKRLMVKKKKFIIFGSGSAGLQLIKYLESKDKVGYFIDNDSRKWGTHIENYIIESPEKLNAENPDDILILVSSTYYKEISMQLISMGFVENKNFVNGMNIYKVSRITQFLHQEICGVHPYNTIFSFNYLNVSRVIKDIKENASLFKGTLVDIGAGKSPYYDLFDVEEYIATDLAGSLPNNESRKITQIIGDALQLPLEDGSCDCAVSMQVLEHISDTNKAISEMNRVLKQNGLVLISVPHISPIHLEPYDFFRFTPIGISRVLQDNGFEVLHLMISDITIPSNKMINLEMLTFLSDNKNSRLAIFGASESGAATVQLIKNFNKRMGTQIETACFIDNNSELRNEIYSGLKVIMPSDIVKNNIDKIIISSSAYNQIAAQLVEQGIDQSDIINVFH